MRLETIASLLLFGLAVFFCCGSADAAQAPVSNGIVPCQPGYPCPGQQIPGTQPFVSGVVNPAGVKIQIGAGVYAPVPAPIYAAPAPYPWPYYQPYIYPAPAFGVWWGGGWRRHR
jgi:hypothetical protein